MKNAGLRVRKDTELGRFLVFLSEYKGDAEKGIQIRNPEAFFCDPYYLHYSFKALQNITTLKNCLYFISQTDVGADNYIYITYNNEKMIDLDETGRYEDLAFDFSKIYSELKDVTNKTRQNKEYTR